MQKSILALSGIFFFSTTLFGATLSKNVENPSLIVYNSNLGLVHEERDLTLHKEDKSIIYKDVASSINTDSINIKLDSSIKLNSQQFRYDKLTQAKLLEAHIGKKVDVRRLKNANEFQLLSATLLAYSGDEAIVKTIDYQVLTVKSSSIIFESIPKELITKPSLVWNVEASQDIKTKLELDYLINNITFKSDYVLNLDKNSSNLNGWITIDNRSGKSFENTKLSLLAGDINRASQRNPIYKNVRAVALMDSATEVSHKAYEGYHFYTIPFNVTLANNEKTQIKFVTKNRIKTKRNYASHLSNPLYLQGERKSNVTQYISLEALDTPLPKGVVRTYSKLGEDTILLGETDIEHTPKATPIKLKLGTNFDLKVTQILINRDDSQTWLKSDVEYNVKNSSNEAKTLELMIPFNRDNDSRVQTDKKYEFTKGNLVTFTLLVAPGATEKFNVHFESRR
jgi:hypothetical protein